MISYNYLKEHDILKGTDKEIVARDFEGGLIVIPYKGIESMVAEENKFSFTYVPNGLPGDIFIAKSENIEMRFSIIAGIKGTKVRLYIMKHIVEADTVIGRFADLYCDIFRIITPTNHGPRIGRVARRLNPEPQFQPLYKFGEDITREVVKKSLIREEISIAIARNELAGSHFNFDNRRFLKYFGSAYTHF